MTLVPHDRRSLQYTRTLKRIAALVVALVPLQARADYLRPFKIVEAVIPDVRSERGFTPADDHRWVLSLPVMLRGPRVTFGSTTGIGFNHFVEAQYQIDHGNVRGLVGERVLFKFYDKLEIWMPLLEVAGVLGQDGFGVAFGTGLVWGDFPAGVTLGIVGRYVITNHEQRGDIALDVAIPLNITD